MGQGDRAMSAERAFVERYGPWVVVTGASDGIGEAFAFAAARRGLNVVIAARRRDRLEAVKASIEERHRVDVKVVVCDLGRAEGIESLLAETDRLPVGLLVAGAGFGTSGDFADSDLGAELDMLAVNCRAPLQLSRAFAPKFILNGRGGIVFFGSVLGFQGVPRLAHYAATKAYIQTLAEGLMVELSKRGVDVVACAPGPVLSGFGARADMRITAGDTPRDVAEETMNRLRGGGTLRPGRMSKLLGWSLAGLPRRVRTMVLAQVMAGVTGIHG